MAPKSLSYCAKARLNAETLAAKSSLKVTEEPRSAQTPSTDNNAVTLALIHHRKSVLSAPNISVTENGNTGNLRLQFADSIPIGMA